MNYTKQNARWKAQFENNIKLIIKLKPKKRSLNVSVFS